ncbi:MAG: TIGR04282 family arsenosugar biosynthesis glycosyltransferase [Hyphomicrobium sp.]
MLKVPVAGKVKTRLAQDIGTIRATFIYRHTLQILLRRVGYSRTWTTILAVSPDTEAATPILPLNLERRIQGRGSLGERLERIFKSLSPKPVIIIGSDIPSITYDDIAKAFHRLKGKSAIIGPSHDGGYWLIGLRGQKQAANLFQSVPWSSKTTLQRTLQNLLDFDVTIFTTLRDIDNKSDYEKLKHMIGQSILSPFKKRI